MSELPDWLSCPDDPRHDVSINEVIADRGGVEKLIVQCDDCAKQVTYIP